MQMVKILVLFTILQIGDRLFVPLADENEVNIDIVSLPSWAADIESALVRTYAQLIIIVRVWLFVYKLMCNN